MKSNEVINIISQFPEWIQVILLSLLLLAVIIISLLRVKALRDAVIYFIEKKIYKIRTCDIKNHRIFKERYLLKHRVNTIFFNDKYKEDVLKLFYNTKLEVDYNNLDAVKFDDGIKDIDTFQFSTEMFRKMQSEFDIKIKDKLDDYCLKKIGETTLAKRCSQELLEFVMNSKGGFNEHRISRIDDLISAAELINTSPLFDNNNERVYQLLDILHANISKAVMTVSRIFVNFNGQIREIIEKYINIKNCCL